MDAKRDKFMEQKEVEEEVNEESNDEVVPVPCRSSILRCYKDSRGVIVLKQRFGERM